MKHIFLLFALFASSSVSAQWHDISGNKVFLPIPKGYCYLDKNDPNDVVLIDGFNMMNKNVNVLLSIFADCEQLINWRKGILSSLNDFGYVFITSAIYNTNITHKKSHFLSEISKKIGDTSFLKEKQRDIFKAYEMNAKNVKLNEIVNLGLVGMDDNAIYLGIIQNIQADNGENKSLVGMTAMTLINEKVINLSLYKKYESKRNVYDLEGLMKNWVVNTSIKNR